MPEMDAIDIFGWLGYEIFLALFLGSLEDMETIYASAPAVRQSISYCISIFKPIPYGIV